MTAEAGVEQHSRPDQVRLDQWLIAARFCKSRQRAKHLIEGSRLRVNRQPVAKPGYRVQAGDVLTFQHQDAICVVRIAAVSSRRGPASAARALYDDLAGKPPKALNS
jgi:ribosome-associated heat shock protein Hsp15